MSITLVQPAQVPSNPNIKFVRLDGKDWPISPLAPRQNRLVLPKIMGMIGKIDVTSLTTAQYDDLIDVVYIGLTRNHPQMVREQILDMDVSTIDLMEAFKVVAIQTGLIKTDPVEEAGGGVPLPDTERTQNG